MKLFELLGVLFVLYNFQLSQAKDLFQIARNSNEVLHYLADIPQNSIIFLDIDDTIITPISKTFRRAPYNSLIDDIKKIRANTRIMRK